MSWREKNIKTFKTGLCLAGLRSNMPARSGPSIDSCGSPYFGQHQNIIVCITMYSSQSEMTIPAEEGKNP